MTIQTTRYSPDTCDCVIDYDWDDTQTEDNRIHTLKTFVKRCPAHVSLADDKARWDAVFDENPRKNKALQFCLENGPSSLYDVIDGSRQLKNNITFNYSWSGNAPNRVLSISFDGINLTSNQKNTIRNVLNSLGAGKVVLS